MARKDEKQTLQEVLNTFLNENNLQKGLDQVDLSKAWTDVLGPGVAAYTQSVRFKAGKLTVKLNSSVLREELSMGQSKIITILNDHLGKDLVESIILV
jgi:predicted nucleic acid-binding Zn ribbon protein